MSYELNQYYYSGAEEKTWLKSLNNNSFVTGLILMNRGIDNITDADSDIDALTLTYANSFKDICIRFAPTEKNTFSADTTYYVRCRIERDVSTQQSPISSVDNDQEFQIKLISAEINEDEGNLMSVDKTVDIQYVKTFTVYHTDNLTDQNRWRYVDFVFTPKSNNFNAILFQLSRMSLDYYSERIPRLVLLEIGEVKNIIGNELNTDEDKKYSNLLKIGIQSIPGTRMIINNEEIYVGRTGIYELKNSEVQVNQFSIITPNELPNEALILKDINTTTNLEELPEYGQKNDYVNEQNLTSNYYFIKKNNELRINPKSNCYDLYQQIGTERKFPSFILDYLYNQDNKE